MINFIKEHTAKNVRICIVNIKDRQRALLEILKLEDEIPYFDSKEDALSTITNIKL